MPSFEKLKKKLFTTNEFGVEYQDPLARLTDQEIEECAKEYGIRTDVHRMCVNCQLRHLIKYKDKKFKDPETNEMVSVDKFDIKCSFVPKNMPPELVAKYHQLVNSGKDPAIAQKVLMAAIDPVAWAELAFGFDDNNEEWHLRSYQSEQLRCSSDRIVVREGRRCLSKNTPIMMKDGTWKPIYKMRPGDEIITMKNYKPDISQVSYLWNNGTQNVWEVKTFNGLKLVLTSNHPLLVYRNDQKKYIDIDRGLVPGDFIATYRSLEDNELYWEQIESISYVGRERTYDIEVLGDHNFIANGIVSSNSGKTFVMALKLLYFAFNRKTSKGNNTDGEPIISGPEIMIVTPFQTQLITIFNEMEALLKRNPDLASMINKTSGASLYTKTPTFRMQFTNGTKINGFVSGVGNKNDGSGGGTMRGSSASIIYLDEMDLITEETIEKVIKPILLSDTKGEVILIATSTPIGKQSFFYKWCKQSPDWKEDHLPSTVLPQWQKIKKSILSDTTKEGLMTEYMAEFIDTNYGVFKPIYVHRARKSFTYEDISNPIWWRDSVGISATSQEIIKCIGIDWNETAGTEFVVLAYIPSRDIYLLLDAINVPPEGNRAEKWKKSLMALNVRWKPDYIYADHGYGHTMIEDIQVLATSLASKKTKNLFETETAKLKDKLKSIDFGSNLELRNPADNIVFKKAAKAFLVEQTRRIIEDNGSKGAGAFWIPENEDVLVKQLLNYVVLKTHKINGNPIYGPENSTIGDHRLDALMLAVGGIAIENGLYAITTNTSSEVLVSEDFNLIEREHQSQILAVPDMLRTRSTSSRANFSSAQETTKDHFHNAPKQKHNYDPDYDNLTLTKRDIAGKYRRGF